MREDKTSRKQEESVEEWEDLDYAEESAEGIAGEEEADELDEDLEIFEEFEDFGDLDDSDDLESEESMSPAFLAVTGILIAIAAVILCALIWMVTHRNDGASDSYDTGKEGTRTQESQETKDTEASLETDSQGASEPSGTEPSSEQPSSEQPSSEQPSSEQSPSEQPSSEQSPSNTETSGEAGVQAPIDGTADSMSFQTVEENVTAKDVTNLRTEPTTQKEEVIVAQLKNGETAVRTGYNADTGWSRVEYNGQTLYAVTQFLTTDLEFEPLTPEDDKNRVLTNDKRMIIFQDCDDYVTPKMHVNLRTEPSTSQGDATVSVQIKNGTTVHRTGYDADAGWSRVEYEGQVLYVVTSLVVGAEAE